jgi:alkylation response protein AidB-like acyl-CoA dehydrogenase
MGRYKTNVRDLEFNLFEVLNLEKALATGEFGELDGESVRQMLDEAARQAEGPLAESFADADRNPPTFDPGSHTVRLPESFKNSLRAWQQGEWFRIGLSENVGGVPAPSMLAWAINEFALGAQPAAFMYLAGPIMADILDGIGNEQQRHWAALMIERNWGATMVLTEPDAGSDVGAGRTKAIQQSDGSWHLDGVKRSITSGDPCSRTSCTWCWPGQRAPGRGPRASASFSYRSFISTPRRENPASAMGFSSPVSSTRWA